jgi:hypothetical protein
MPARVNRLRACHRPQGNSVVEKLSLFSSLYTLDKQEIRFCQPFPVKKLQFAAPQLLSVYRKPPRPLSVNRFTPWTRIQPSKHAVFSPVMLHRITLYLPLFADFDFSRVSAA